MHSGRELQARQLLERRYPVDVKILVLEAMQLAERFNLKNMPTPREVRLPDIRNADQEPQNLRAFKYTNLDSSSPQNTDRRIPQKSRNKKIFRVETQR